MVRPVPEWVLPNPWACPAGRPVLRYTATREEWLAARRSGVGASEVASVLGLSRYKGTNPWAVWADKTGLTPARDATRAMVRGLMMERALVDLWVAEDATFPIIVKRRGLMRSRQFPVLMASLDFVSVCPAGRCTVEAKTQSDMRDWDGNEVPLEFQIQGQAQLLVTGRDHVHFVAMGSRFEIQHRTMYRDEALMGVLAARVDEWWRYHVLGGEPPPAAAENLPALRALYGNPPDEVAVELPEWLWDHPTRVDELKTRQAAVKVEIETLEAQLCAALGDATIGTIDGRPAVTWRRTKKIVGATKDFLRRHRDLVGPYLTKVEALADPAELVADHPELLTDGTLRYQRNLDYL